MYQLSEQTAEQNYIPQNIELYIDNLIAKYISTDQYHSYEEFKDNPELENYISMLLARIGFLILNRFRQIYGSEIQETDHRQKLERLISPDTMNALFSSHLDLENIYFEENDQRIEHPDYFYLFSGVEELIRLVLRNKSNDPISLLKNLIDIGIRVVGYRFRRLYELQEDILGSVDPNAPNTTLITHSMHKITSKFIFRIESSYSDRREETS